MLSICILDLSCLLIELDIVVVVDVDVVFVLDNLLSCNEGLFPD